YTFRIDVMRIHIVLLMHQQDAETPQGTEWLALSTTSNESTTRLKSLTTKVNFGVNAEANLLGGGAWQ
ncbi:hypothetical protein ACPH3O_004473, partial [Cronobacter sakazakii]